MFSESKRCLHNFLKILSLKKIFFCFLEREEVRGERETEKQPFIASHMCSDLGLNLNSHCTERHSNHCTTLARATQL